MDTRFGFRKNTLLILAGCTVILLSIIIIVFYTSPLTATKVGYSSARASNNHSFSVLTANVGNLNLGCLSYLNKLCDIRVEQRITKNIKALRPDIIALQEVLAEWQCQKESNRNRVCYYRFDEPQARRLIGPDYTIVCEPRHQFECIAIHKEIGEIIGCDVGSLCNSATSNTAIEGCDNGFTISSVTVKPFFGAEFDIVNVHPQSTDAECREQMIKSIFESNETPIITSQKVMILGDFNFDPWRDKDVSAITWRKYFDMGWGGSNFRYHSGFPERTPPYFTAYPFRRTMDFITTNFATGTGVVLGNSPGTSRLDGGKGMDHRAVFAILNHE